MASGMDNGGKADGICVPTESEVERQGMPRQGGGWLERPRVRIESTGGKDRVGKRAPDGGFGWARDVQNWMAKNISDQTFSKPRWRCSRELPHENGKGMSTDTDSKVQNVCSCKHALSVMIVTQQTLVKINWHIFILDENISTESWSYV